MNQEFKTFVLQKVRTNEKMIVNKKKLEVKVILEFAALFRKTDSLSSIPFILMKYYRGKRKVWKIIGTRQEEKVLGNGA